MFTGNNLSGVAQQFATQLGTMLHNNMLVYITGFDMENSRLPCTMNG